MKQAQGRLIIVSTHHLKQDDMWQKHEQNMQFDEGRNKGRSRDRCANFWLTLIQLTLIFN